MISKIDRLCLEIKIPPSDAYLKIKHTIEEVNGVLADELSRIPRENQIDFHMSPLKGNVIFSSNEYGFFFSLKSFAEKYTERYPALNSETFTKVLWGNFYFDKESRRFVRKLESAEKKRAFVEFILEPLYKILGHTASYEREELEPTLKKIGIYLKKQDYKRDTKELIKMVCTTFFGGSSVFVDLVSLNIPSAKQGNSKLVNQTYTGDKSTEFYKEFLECDKDKPLLINVIKLYNKQDCLRFDALGRVLSGTIKVGQQLKVLGESYSLQDREDMTVKTVSNLFVHQGRFRTQIKTAYAGNWVLIEGVSDNIQKTATLIDLNNTNEVEIFRPIKFNAQSYFKIALEPFIPSELPKMLEGLRKVSKSYPLLETKVEESGEHLIIGTGELYMESVLHDLRMMYSEIEIKISDPTVTFAETVIDTSSIKCITVTPNKLNKFVMIAEALDGDIAKEIEAENIDLRWDREKTAGIFREKYNWDILAANSVWAFGPTDFGPNMLLNDTLPSETDQDALASIQNYMVHGFKWCTKEGPLCEEPIRNAKFKLLEADLASEQIYRAGGQIIPTVRRCCYSAFLLGNPRIMEPLLHTEILCTRESLPAVYNVLNRRRGQLMTETAKPGTPLFLVQARIPALDSFGFETDLRVHTTGQAFNLSVFDSWIPLPGDPLDRSVQLKILEPSTPMELAREVMVKLR